MVNFPTSLDTFVDPLTGDALGIAGTHKHSTQHQTVNAALAALEVKLGITGSAVVTSADYLEQNPGNTHAVTNGFGTMPRSAVNGSAATATGRLNLAGFIAGKSFTVANISMYASSGNGTATLFKFGLYTLDASGNGTLVASTANSTATAAGAGKLTIALSTPYAITQGVKYAVAQVHVTGAGPTFNTATAASGASTHLYGGAQPFVGALLAAQTDLPGSFTFAGISVATPIYFELTT